ncbi:YciI family protein [Friedmanniella luteola]|nr:YciI family protein [Friedmanniella luteola]
MLLVIGFHPDEPEGQGPPVTGEGPSVEEFLAYERALLDAGVRVSGSALAGVDVATTVQVDGGGRRLLTNGPYPETREFLGGFDIVDVPDLDAALDWAARCPGARYGRVEVRPLAEF